MWRLGIPGAHATSINNLTNHVLLGLLQDLEAEHATINQQHVIHTDIINEAIVVDRDATILAVCALLDGECVFGTCA